jgi:hypothetical protein
MTTDNIHYKYGWYWLKLPHLQATMKYLVIASRRPVTLEAFKKLSKFISQREINFFFKQTGLNSGPHVCLPGALQFEPLLQPCFVFDVYKIGSHTVWQNGLKKKIQQFVAYRRFISPTEISICLGWKAGRRFTKPVAPENRQE